MEQIDRKYLKGLKFKSAKVREVGEKDGRKIKQYFETQRAMTPEDVLSWRDAGDTIVLVSADGQKVTVPKTAA